MNKLCILLLALLAAVPVLPSPAQAQLSLLPPAQKKSEEAPPPPLDTAAKRAENARLLRIAQLETSNATNGQAGAVDLLKSIDSVLAQQQAAEQQVKELESRKAELQKSIESLSTQGIGEKPPYSFLLFDRLRDEAAAEKSRGDVLADKVVAATAAVQQAKADLDREQREKRQAQTEADNNTDAAKTAPLAAAVAQADQEIKLAQETFALRKLEATREKLTQDIQALSLQLAEAKLAEVKKHVEFLPGDLDQILTQIQKQESDIKLEISLTERSLREAEKKWSEARAQFDEGNGDRKLLSEEVEAWRLDRELAQQKLNMLNRQLQRLTQLRTLWERRFQVFNGEAKSDDVAQWLEESKEFIKGLDREDRVQRANINERRKTAATIDTKVENARQESPKLAHWYEEQVAHTRAMVSLYEKELTQIESARSLQQKLSNEIAPDRLKLSPTEWWSTIKRKAYAFWTFEIAKIDEDTPITVNTIIKGVLSLVIGILLARLAAGIIVKRVLHRSKMSRDAKAVVRTLIFYTLLVFVALYVLNTMKVPLTAFTVIGGALALGVGLGSQNLVNNFLSGLIVMAERPVRIGDRIVFGNFDGFVEEVGFRSTRIRTLTDHVVVIPNASLVSDTIENIERRRCVRRLFNVTITYDTPREKIIEAVQTLRDILEEPGICEPIHPVFGWDEYPPRVCFNDFNSDSLNILVVYWYAPPNYWEFLLHSEKVNLRIFEEFERIGVEFAFPTQTLFLARDEKRQLAVEMLNNGDRPARNGSRSGPDPYA